MKYVQVSPGREAIAVGDVVPIDAAAYAQGSRYEISDGTTILASGELR